MALRRPENSAFRTGFSWRLRASSAWIIFGFCLTVKNLLLPTRRTLWPCYAAACENWWKGWSLYDRKVIAFDYRYSPTFAVSYTPFTWGPDWLGATLWGIFLTGGLWIALNQLQRDVLPLHWNDRKREVWLLLSLLGMSHSLWSGQSNVLIVSCVAAGTAAIIREKWWLAGFLLVCPGFIKVWPFLLTALCLISRPRRLALPCLTWGLIAAALPLATQKPRYVLDEYIEWSRCMQNGPIATRLASYDAWALWEAVWPPVSESGYLGLQVVSVLGLIGLDLWMSRRRIEIKWQLTTLLIAWSSWQLFLGPGVEKNTLSLLTPFSSWCLIRARERQRGWILVAIGLVMTFLAIQINDTWALRLGGEWVRLLHPLGLVVLWAGILRARVLQNSGDFKEDFREIRRSAREAAQE